MEEVPEDVKWIFQNPPSDMFQFLQQQFEALNDSATNALAPASAQLLDPVQNVSKEKEQLGNQVSEKRIKSRKPRKQVTSKKASKSPMGPPTMVPVAARFVGPEIEEETTVGQVLKARANEAPQSSTKFKPHKTSKRYQNVTDEVSKIEMLTQEEAMGRWKNWKLQSQGMDHLFLNKYLFNPNRGNVIVPQFVPKATSIQSLYENIKSLTKGKTWGELTTIQKEYWTKRNQMIQEWQKEQEDLGLIKVFI
ncbi:hypothetical protein CAEBREN_12434 [Caenorhabditis brenneri]|uniref:Uncharacterized protein n=1 Tax=Caenorhabditis brenneri TaxID=135651 RepID=G0P4F7_CAEBE|nr:hypothetical protein CAEBREN_12434 [Caenorhabditis brenneri]